MQRAREPLASIAPADDRPAVTTEFAVIVHVSDLHLDESRRAPAARRAMVLGAVTSQPWWQGDDINPGVTRKLPADAAEGIRRIAERLLCKVQHVALPGILDDLEDRLTEIAHRTSAPVATGGRAPELLLTHTGDAEAFGRGVDHRFRGWEALLGTPSAHGPTRQNGLWHRMAAQGFTCLDVYGNHDIWPPHLITRNYAGQHSGGPAMLAAAHPVFARPWSPYPDTPNAHAVPAVAARLSTVRTDVTRGAMLAQGKIDKEEGEMADPADRLAPLTRWPAGVHLLLTHHPVYLRAPAISPKEVEGADALRTDLAGRMLVLSGHTHRLHPPLGARGGAPQLVAPSAGVRGGAIRTLRPAFCVYRAFARPGATSEPGVPTRPVLERVEVAREVYEHTLTKGYTYSPETDRPIAGPLT